MVWGELKYQVNEKGRVSIPPRFRRELKDGVALTPEIKKCTTTYTLPEWKKYVVCNFLVRMRFNGFKPEPAIRQQR